MDNQGVVEMAETVGAAEDAVDDEQALSASGETNGEEAEGIAENSSSPQGADSASNNENETSQTSGARSVENPPAKKIKLGKEAEHLLTALPEKEKESIALLKTPAELIASFRYFFIYMISNLGQSHLNLSAHPAHSQPLHSNALCRQLARNPQEAQREDDECKSSLLEVLRLRHELAVRPDGWLARVGRRRPNRDAAPQRWGVTDSGALCSRIGPNYQVTMPTAPSSTSLGTEDTERSIAVFAASCAGASEAVEAFLERLTPVYRDYVLRRQRERASYRDMGAFREFALARLAEHGYRDVAAAAAVEAAMRAPAALEVAAPRELWTRQQVKCPFSPSPNCFFSHSLRIHPYQFSLLSCFPSPFLPPSLSSSFLPSLPPSLPPSTARSDNDTRIHGHARKHRHTDTHRHARTHTQHTPTRARAHTRINTHMRWLVLFLLARRRLRRRKPLLAAAASTAPAPGGRERPVAYSVAWAFSSAAATAARLELFREGQSILTHLSDEISSRVHGEWRKVREYARARLRCHFALRLGVL
jgi:hypothetical protein